MPFLLPDAAGVEASFPVLSERLRAGITGSTLAHCLEGAGRYSATLREQHNPFLAYRECGERRYGYLRLNWELAGPRLRLSLLHRKSPNGSRSR